MWPGFQHLIPGRGGGSLRGPGIVACGGPVRKWRQGVWNPTSSLSPRQGDTTTWTISAFRLFSRRRLRFSARRSFFLLDKGEGNMYESVLRRPHGLPGSELREFQGVRAKRATYPSSRLLLVLRGWRAREETIPCLWTNTQRPAVAGSS